MIQTADVKKLKCIFFYYTKTLMEIDWYGLKCNRIDYLNNGLTAKYYLDMINSNCTLPYKLECAIREFIKNKANNCITVLSPCIRTVGSLSQTGEGGDNGSGNT